MKVADLVEREIQAEQPREVARDLGQGVLGEAVVRETQVHQRLYRLIKRFHLPNTVAGKIQLLQVGREVLNSADVVVAEVQLSKVGKARQLAIELLYRVPLGVEGAEKLVKVFPGADVFVESQFLDDLIQLQGLIGPLGQLLITWVQLIVVIVCPSNQLLDAALALLETDLLLEVRVLVLIDVCDPNLCFDEPPEGLGESPVTSQLCVDGFLKCLYIYHNKKYKNYLKHH